MPTYTIYRYDSSKRPADQRDTLDNDVHANHACLALRDALPPDATDWPIVELPGDQAVARDPDTSPGFERSIYAERTGNVVRADEVLDLQTARDDYGLTADSNAVDVLEIALRVMIDARETWGSDVEVLGLAALLIEYRDGLKEGAQ